MVEKYANKTLTLCKTTKTIDQAKNKFRKSNLKRSVTNFMMKMVNSIGKALGRHRLALHLIRSPPIKKKRR
jgi:hypothetical protein